MALSDHYSEWTRQDCGEAVVLIQRWRGALESIARLGDHSGPLKQDLISVAVVAARNALKSE